GSCQRGAGSDAIRQRARRDGTRRAVALVAASGAAWAWGSTPGWRGGGPPSPRDAPSATQPIEGRGLSIAPPRLSPPLGGRNRTVRVRVLRHRWWDDGRTAIFQQARERRRVTDGGAARVVVEVDPRLRAL